ncbi:MAG: EamA family transporter [Acidimicrobiales bacterium]
MRRIVLLSLIWGWSFLLIKVALGGMTPATVAFGRVSLGLAVILAVLRARGDTMPRGAHHWRHFAVMGLAYSVAPFTLLAWAEQHITSALTAVVNATTAMFTAVAAAIGLAERLRPPQLAGLLVGFSGVAVAAGLSRSDLSSSSGAGIAAAAVASACYGFSFVYAQRHLAAVPPLVATCGQLVSATVLSAPLALGTSLADGFSPNWRQLLATTALGVGGTGIAYVLIYQALADVGPTRSALVTYLVPIVAVAAGALFLDEPFQARLVAGGALTIAGVALVQDRFRRRPRLPAPPAAGAVALLLMVLIAACGGGDPGSSACGPATQDPLDPGSTRHILPGAEEPDYVTDPPTSGPHQAGVAPAGAQREPVARPVQVTVLEGGGVMVQYRDLSPVDRRRVEALAGDGVVVAPNPDLSDPVVATAWRYRLSCDSAGEAAVDDLRQFIEARRNRGPGH